MRPITFQLAIVVLAVCCRPSTAQCQLEWSSGGPQSQLSGQAECSTLWDPDGAGPLPQRLVIGGTALLAGDEPTNQRVMTWDGTEWAALGNGPGIGGTVHALTTWNGQLVAAGHLVGSGIDNIALWNGSAWQALGTGFPVVVEALTVWNGNLVAAGYTFTTTYVPVIMTWDGVAWTALPAPPLLQIPQALTSFQGFLYVGGYRPTPYQGALERWNGTSWSASITADANIHCLAVRAVSLVTWLYVGGSFTNIGGTAASRVASSSGGTAFTPVGNGLSQPCLALHVRSISPLVPAVVALTSFAYQLDNGTGTWVSMGGLLPLTSVNYYGGVYHATSEAGDNSCVRFNSPNWVPVRGPGIDGEVRAATRLGSDMIVGGTFGAIGATAASRIARWNGTTFTPLGTGMTGNVSNGLSVDSLLTLDNGNVVAGGLFVNAGGVTANSIARWNGTTWSSLGSGVDQQVLSICEMPNGDVIVGGWFVNAGGVPCTRIARWNGSVWSPLGSGMNGSVQALAVRGDGVLFAGGSFSVAGGVPCSRIAQWNGSLWLPVSVGCNGDVFELAVRPNGDVIAVGSFTSAGGLPADRCARWTATGWSSMGTVSADPSAVHAVVALPNGDVVVGHGFHTPTNDPDEGLSRWNGIAWSGLGTLGAHYATQRVLVRCLAQAADGDLVIGGTFSLADGTISRCLTKVESTCMPLVLPYGAGCSSSGGPLVITADTLPWIGATFQTTTTGVAPVSLCIGVIGLSQVSIPLDLLLAEGQPGCTLLAALDILLFLQNGPGTAHSAFALEADPSLIGVTFYQQTAPLEFDAGGNIVAIRSSNALAATIGTL